MKQRLLVNGEFSDVRFAVGRDFGPVKIFAAHKNILAARSSVFCTMFYGSLPENCAVPIDIPDFMPDAFANMLCFMYTDEVENLTAENAFDTMKCADKYDVAPLVQMCLEKNFGQLDVDNCLSALEKAFQWHADSFLQKCWKLLDEKTEEILRSDEFTGIPRDTLRSILQRSTLSAEEHDIYLAVERWATEACKQNDLEPSAVNRRQMLGDALFLVRFPLLTAAQLANGPGTNGLLTDSELLSIFLYQHSATKPPLPFPTEQRRSVLLAKGYRMDDAVFVRVVGADWLLAKIIGVRQSLLVIRWAGDGREESVEPGDVVLAADMRIDDGSMAGVVYSPGSDVLLDCTNP
ncbi:BTB/POZ domain-containing protein 6-A-like [Paramacrobiotus metropolitanus]|uniref:BTB/POZ domain-containing protein 6-A-like n=1 Tax=Paramacrobiotus metropolitanus TaxID=2943436 RepID=UPI002445AF27|nr:BTB/POZ domain-containing protein 6-A-like [Paramacrobiotus metropolitanus]